MDVLVVPFSDLCFCIFCYCMRWFNLTIISNWSPSLHTVYDTGLKKPNKKIDRLDKILEKQPFLTGEKFTLADVAVASYLLYVLQFFPGVDLSRWPHVKAYMRECCSRPAYAKAFGDRVQGALLSQLGSGEESKKKFFGVL